ncbi:13078_t:CDS:2, partial [Racocetra fulgida]
PNVPLILPNDSEEAIRFNASINLNKKLFSSNYSAPVTKLLECARKCFRINGHDPDLMDTIPEKLKTLNIKKIQVVEMQLPLSHRKVTSGDQDTQDFLLRTVEAYRVILNASEGFSNEEYDELKRKIAIEGETMDMSIKRVRIFGQKQETMEEIMDMGVVTAGSFGQKEKIMEKTMDMDIITT